MATKTITQRIAFVGGEEMEVQLKQIGDAGAAAFVRLKAAADNASGFGVKLSLAIDQVKAGLVELGASATKASQGFNNLESAGKTVEQRFKTAAIAVVGFTTAVAALVVKAGFATEEIEKGAAAAQLSTNDYQSLRNAFIVGGAGAETFDNLVKRLNNSFGVNGEEAQKLQKAQNDLGKEFASGKINSQQYSDSILKLQEDARENVTAFTQLGITFDSVGGKTKEAVLKTLEQINKLEPGIKRARLELEVFGRSGVAADKLASTITLLRADIEGVIPKFDEFELKIGAQMTTAVRILGEVADNSAKKLLLLFAPDVTLLANALTAGINSGFKRLEDIIADLEVKIRPFINEVADFLAFGKVDPNGQLKVVLQVLTDIGKAIVFIGSVVSTVFGALEKALDPVAVAINKVFGTDIDGRVIAIIALVTAFSGALSLIAPIITIITAAATALDFVLVAAFGPAGAIIAGIALLTAAFAFLAKDTFPSVQAAWDVVADAISNSFKFLEDQLTQFVDNVKKIASAVASLFSSAQSGAGGGQATDVGGAGFASGGKVNGRGSSTSDSILSWLSNGEFVQRAAAVGYYGADFMSKLNNLAIPKSLLRGLSGFADGGFVGAISRKMEIPAFANGGMVQAIVGNQQSAGGRPFVLNINGERFDGLTAEDRTFDRLKTFAVKRTVQSAGRKPLWVG